MKIRTQPVASNEHSKLIDFDNNYLINVMKEMGISDTQLPPSLEPDELEKAFLRKDTLEWIFVNDVLAGYFWFEKKIDHIYISGFAIKHGFQGIGLCQYVLNKAKKIAEINHLNFCRLAVIPLNGRAINAYLKCGYKITSCIPKYFGEDYPDSFRFIMEYDLSKKNMTYISTFGREVSCIDHEGLKNATDLRYAGVRIIRTGSNSNSDNYILFEKPY